MANVRQKKSFIFILLMFVFFVLMLFGMSTFSHANMQESYLEFRTVSIKDIPGKDKQAIVELWGHNIDIKGLDFRLKYDETKLNLSNIQTNEYTEDELEYFSFENDFENSLYMFTVPYKEEGKGLRMVIMLDPPYTNPNSHIITKPDIGDVIDTTGGVLIGKFSFRLSSGKIETNDISLKESTTSPVTGIKINYDGTNSYEDPSMVRFTDESASDNANLSGILIDGSNVVNFDKNQIEHEIKLTGEKEKITIIPIAEDSNAKIMENGQIVPNEGLEVELKPLGQDTVIEFQVIAEDEVTTKQYRITIKRTYGTIKGNIETSSKQKRHMADIRIFPKGLVDWENMISHEQIDTILTQKTEKINEDGSYEIKIIPGEYDILIDKDRMFRYHL